MENIENPILTQSVDIDTPIKEWLVDYVGEKKKPEGKEVTTEMIVETMTEEFPEFLMAVAEENWIRGYQQAIVDVEEGEKLIREEMQKRVQKDDETGKKIADKK
jgi:hypothetical protein